ncbi:hypothetical protein MIR68_001106 [Amoeboaphelidium protococcarum]|nr:hypothetical protein MIR68_001106 [Amoeboaphelidium protococcarum]
MESLIQQDQPPQLAYKWFKATNNPVHACYNWQDELQNGTPKNRDTPSRTDKIDHGDNYNDDYDESLDSTPHRDTKQAQILNDQAQSNRLAGVPTVWTQFSAEEELALENVYVALQKNQSQDGKVIVHEDYLYEVDIQKRIIYPVYWDGPAYPVIRASWFTVEGTGANAKYNPIEELMAQQIEDGYLKYKPYNVFAPLIASSQQQDDKSESILSPTSQSSQQGQTQQQQYQQQQQQQQSIQSKLKWSLFGKYSAQFVVYNSQTGGWLCKDDITSTVAQAIYVRISSSNESYWGTRVIRGWNNVEDFRSKSQKSEKSGSSSPSKKPVQSSSASSQQQPLNTKAATQAKDDGKENKQSAIESVNSTQEWLQGQQNIRHLVFAIHGIGQKLGEKLSAVNFIEDVTVLRKNFKDSIQNNIVPVVNKKSAKKSSGDNNQGKPELYKPPNIMVIPIEWRKKLSFDERPVQDQDMPEDEVPSLQDINLDTIPALRNIISDVLLDVLLYMEPRHKTDMLVRLISEMNRLYAIFVSKHPSFLEPGADGKVGQVHVVSHSLGSIIVSDVLCYHHDVKQGLVGQPADCDQPESPVDLSEVYHQKYPSLAIKKKKRQYDDEVRTCLNFSVSKFFLLGSPLGLFALLKSKRIGASLTAMLEFYQLWHQKHPFCLEDDKSALINQLWDFHANEVMHFHMDGMYSIIHPNDPIANRCEPMIAKSLATQKPAVVPNGKPSSSLFNIGEIASKTTNDFANKATGLLDQLKSTVIASMAFKQTMSTMEGDKVKQDNIELDAKLKKSKDRRSKADRMSVRSDASSVEYSSGMTTNPFGGRSDTPVPEVVVEKCPSPKFTTEQILACLNPRRRRLDYSLNISFIENPYLSALSAHFNYWKDEDCGTFIMKEVLEIPIDDHELN